MPNDAYVQTITIAISTDGTGGAGITVDGPNQIIAGIIPPGTLTGTATLQVSIDAGANWVDIFDFDKAASMDIPAGALGEYYALKEETMSGVRRFRVVSGSSEAAERVFTVVLKNR